MDLIQQKINQINKSSGGAVKRLMSESDNSNVEKPQGLFNKLSNIGEKILSKPSELLFGTTGKTVGGLITRGIGGVKTLTAKTPEQLAEARRLSQVGEPTVGDIAFTALELYPGGGLLKNTLKKIPGSKQLIQIAENVVNRIPEGLRERAIQELTKIIKPTTQKTKFVTEKIAPKIIDDIPITATKEKLLGKVESKVYEFGDKIDEFIKNMGDEATKIDIKTQPLLDSLAEAKKQFSFLNDAGKEIVTNKNALAKITELEGMVSQLGGSASFNTLRKMRQILDAEISKAGGFLGKTLAEGTEAELKSGIANSIRNELAKDSPDLAKLNLEYSNWKNFEYVLTEGLKRDAGKTMGLKSKVTAVIGGIAGGAKGAVALTALEKIFNSTLWKTININLKTSLAKSIESGSTSKFIEAVNAIIRRLASGVKNELDIEELQ